ncbi:Polyketide cyclase / dehydrase and lipid transport [Gimesia alba]|uniref:Polyketide cyclase / dehydrase and lipid transport n=2 Tax=Gimesia alba TaxID=2527973 RepID=A0A517R8H0_9PLAN|nr:Polyketide cyclase / dehydrase and lipid transport [Gimesia alba]
MGNASFGSRNMVTINRTAQGIYVLQSELLIPHSISDVFDFFARPENLESLTPPWLHFQIVTPKPVPIHEGALIDYRLKLHGFPMKWKTEITDWEPPVRFVDLQLKGPYRFWRHEHTFQEQAGGTLVRDKVEYAVLGGALINRLFVQKDVERIFQYRLDRLKSFPPTD